MARTLRSISYRLGVLCASLVGALIGAIPVFSLGLFVPGPMVLFLTLANAALFSALAAAWAGILLAPAASTTRILPVIAASLVVSLPLAILALATSALTPDQSAVGSIVVGLVALSLISSAATWRWRKPRGPLRRDVLISLGLVVAAIVVVVLSTAITCSFVQCIA